MKHLFAIFALMLTFSMSAYASIGKLGDRINVIDLAPVASVVASGDSTAVDLVNYEGNCAAIVDVSAPVAGTTPGLALKLTESDTSGGAYTDVASGAFTAVSSSASVQKLVVNKNKQKRFLKLNRVLSGTSSPQYLVSAKLLCDKKQR
jgi:hypothetical protein